MHTAGKQTHLFFLSQATVGHAFLTVYVIIRLNAIGMLFLVMHRRMIVVLFNVMKGIFVFCPNVVGKLTGVFIQI